MADAPSPDDPGDSTEITTAAAMLAAGDVAAGTRLGRYEILLPIASGGMARVWAARLEGQRGFTKLVAVKTILPHLAEDAEFERMFLDEARIAAGVHHPNACEIYELGEQGDVLFLAMEWVNGDSLFHVLRGDGGQVAALEPRVAARIVADACAGLHAAHELEGEDGRPLGVVHRDVSPQNVLLSVDGHAKVADFGVAKALGQVHNVTNAGQLRGKIHYMSPEQIVGGVVDRRSDVFALGCVLYEATTGIKAFDGEAEHLAMQAVAAGRYLRPSQVVPGYPAALEHIVAQALAKEPGARFATAERMRAALEQWLARSAPTVITHADVARVVRARVGSRVERRKERLKQAMAAMGERAPMPSVPPEGAGRAGVSHSGVLPMGAGPAPEARASWAGQTPSVGSGLASGAAVRASDAPGAAAMAPSVGPSGEGPAALALRSPPPRSLAAARVGFDLADPPVPRAAPPPADVAELAAQVDEPEPRAYGAGRWGVIPAAALALGVGVVVGLAWRWLSPHGGAGRPGPARPIATLATPGAPAPAATTHGQVDASMEGRAGATGTGTAQAVELRGATGEATSAPAPAASGRAGVAPRAAPPPGTPPAAGARPRSDGAHPPALPANPY